jgi:hypothetical protein
MSTAYQEATSGTLPAYNTGYENLMNMGAAAAQQPYQAYTGQLVADFAPQQNQAFELAGSNVNNWVPNLNQSQNLVQGSATAGSAAYGQAQQGYNAAMGMDLQSLGSNQYNSSTGVLGGVVGTNLAGAGQNMYNSATGVLGGVLNANIAGAGQPQYNQAQNTINTALGANIAGAGQPQYNQAQSLYNTSAQFNPNQVQQYLSPYLGGVVNEINRLGQQQFSEQVAPSIANSYTSLGQFGSARQGAMLADASARSQREIMGQQSQALHQGYNAAMGSYADWANRQQGAAAGITSLGSQQAAQIGQQAQLNLQGANQMQSLGAQQAAQLAQQATIHSQAANQYTNIGQQQANQLSQQMGHQLQAANQYTNIGQQQYQQGLGQANTQIAAAQGLTNTGSKQASDQLNAGAAMGNIAQARQQMGMADYGQLLSAGQLQQQQQQQVNDAAYQQWQNEQNYAWDQTQNLATLFPTAPQVNSSWGSTFKKGGLARLKGGGQAPTHQPDPGPRMGLPYQPNPGPRMGLPYQPDPGPRVGLPYQPDPGPYVTSPGFPSPGPRMGLPYQPNPGPRVGLPYQPGPDQSTKGNGASYQPPIVGNRKMPPQVGRMLLNRAVQKRGQTQPCGLAHFKNGGVVRKMAAGGSFGDTSDIDTILAQNLGGQNPLTIDSYVRRLGLADKVQNSPSMKPTPELPVGQRLGRAMMEAGAQGPANLGQIVGRTGKAYYDQEDARNTGNFEKERLKYDLASRIMPQAPSGNRGSFGSDSLSPEQMRTVYTSARNEGAQIAKDYSFSSAAERAQWVEDYARRAVDTFLGRYAINAEAPRGLPPMGQQGMPPMGQQGMPPMGQQGMPPMGQQGMPPQGRSPMPPMSQQGRPPMGQQGMPSMSQQGRPPMGPQGMTPQSQQPWPQAYGQRPPQGQPMSNINPPPINRAEAARAQTFATGTETTDLDFYKENVEKPAIAAQGMANVLSAIKQIPRTQDALAPYREVLGSVFNAAGLDSNVVREAESLQQIRPLLTKFANESLRQNTGVQTEGDAQRAYNEFLKVTDTQAAADFVYAWSAENARRAQDKEEFFREIAKGNGSWSAPRSLWKDHEYSKTVPIGFIGNDMWTWSEFKQEFLKSNPNASLGDAIDVWQKQVGR